MIDCHSETALKLAISQFPVITLFEKNQICIKMRIDNILIIKELVDYLRLNEKTAYRLVPDGEIPGFKVAGS